jgi:hypothetical protein
VFPGKERGVTREEKGFTAWEIEFPKRENGFTVMEIGWMARG